MAIETLTWALSLPVGALAVAVLGSAVASRWQDELFDKPTLPRAVLLFAQLWLARWALPAVGTA